MTSYVKKFLVFTAIGAVLYGALVTLTLRAAAVYKNGAAIMCEKKREWARSSLTFDADERPVLFMGNSIILSGLVPDVFDRTLGGKVRSYNLALPTLGIGPAYFLVSDLVRRGTPPKYIVMPVIIDRGTGPSLFDYYGVQGATLRREALSFVQRQDKTALFNYVSPMRMYTHEIVKFTVNSLLRRGDIADTRRRNAAVIDQMFHDRGYYYIREEAIFPDGTLPPDYGIDPHADLTPIAPMPFDFEEDPYVRRFFDLTHENHIQVLLIDFIYRDRTLPPFARQPELYAKITARYSNVRVTKTSWQRKFLPNAAFADQGHLNPAGAREFTRLIAREFQEAFGDETVRF